MITTTPTLFLDFDGTVTERDATDAVLEAFADPQWLAIEEDWKAGRIGSRECLASQIALVSADGRDVDALLDEIEVDPGFMPLLEWGVAAEVPIHIVSDGFDYCIQRILARPSLGFERYRKGIRIVSSHLEPHGRRWRASFTAPIEPCAHGCATCKPAAIERLSAIGSPRVFVGDGLSDRFAVATADVVLAKGALAVFCAEQSIPHTRYSSLATVARWLADTFAPGTEMRRTLSGKASLTT